MKFTKSPKELVSFWNLGSCVFTTLCEEVDRYSAEGLLMAVEEFQKVNTFESTREFVTGLRLATAKNREIEEQVRLDNYQEKSEFEKLMSWWDTVPSQDLERECDRVSYVGQLVEGFKEMPGEERLDEKQKAFIESWVNDYIEHYNHYNGESPAPIHIPCLGKTFS